MRNNLVLKESEKAHNHHCYGRLAVNLSETHTVMWSATGGRDVGRLLHKQV